MPKDPKQEALHNALSQIEKQFGKGSIMTFADIGASNVDAISTGSISLDLALGGGIPKGRVIEIYGPESSGKTTLTLHVAAECQKTGGQVAFVDAEHALDPEYAKKIGVDMEKGCLLQAYDGKKYFDVHPDSGQIITGKVIPQWKEIMALAIQTSLSFPLHYLGVDIVLDRKYGPMVLEINVRPGLGIQLANRKGLKNILHSINEKI